MFKNVRQRKHRVKRKNQKRKTISPKSNINKMVEQRPALIPQQKLQCGNYPRDKICGSFMIQIRGGDPLVDLKIKEYQLYPRLQTWIQPSPPVNLTPALLFHRTATCPVMPMTWQEPHVPEPLEQAQLQTWLQIQRQ